jgi:ATP-dependent Clp protease ATP-binding subunit ClpC
MFARFDDAARRVLERANAEARRFNHEYIGTEHILLAVVAENAGVAAAALARLGVTIDRVTRDVEKIIQHGPGGDNRSPPDSLPQTPRAKKVIEYAIGEAREQASSAVGTEHLLIGLMREDEGVAYEILRNFGLTLNRLRVEVGFSPRLGPVPDDVLRRPPTDPQARGVYDLMMAARARKQACIEAQDFELAARCRDEEMALRRELARLLGRFGS